MPEPPAGDPQPLLDFMSNEEWDALIGEVDTLIAQMEQLPDGQVKSDVFRLLDGVDAIHREALRRLVRLFKEGVLEKVVTDPAIHTLMELYDLLPAPSPAAEQEPDKHRFPTIPIRAVPHGPPASQRYPHWIPALPPPEQLQSGAVRDVVLDGMPLLLARRGERLFAFAATCATDGSSMQHPALNGYTLTCPNHSGCHYDIRTGQRIGGGGVLPCHPVRVNEQGRILVGFDMDFVPDVPSF